MSVEQKVSFHKRRTRAEVQELVAAFISSGMLVDPGNRLVADTLEAEWNDKLRALAQAREERERVRQQEQLLLDDAIRQRLVTMTTDFKKLWNHPATPNRERKRLLAYIIEDATLIKLPAEGVTSMRS